MRVHLLWFVNYIFIAAEGDFFTQCVQQLLGTIFHSSIEEVKENLGALKLFGSNVCFIKQRSKAYVRKSYCYPMV